MFYPREERRRRSFNCRAAVIRAAHRRKILQSLDCSRVVEKGDIPSARGGVFPFSTFSAKAFNIPKRRCRRRLRDNLRHSHDAASRS
jgi:hypothetical protein